MLIAGKSTCIRIKFSPFFFFFFSLFWVNILFLNFPSFLVFSRLTEKMQKNTNQKNKKRRVRGQTAVVAGDPVESDGAVVLHTEALPSEPDVGNGAKESGEDGLQVAVPSDDRERVVRTGEGLQGRQERSTNDFERRVGPGLMVWHCAGIHGGGGDGETGGLVEATKVGKGVESRWRGA